jgi:hypothetical protein
MRVACWIRWKHPPTTSVCTKTHTLALRAAIFCPLAVYLQGEHDYSDFGGGGAGSQVPYAGMSQNLTGRSGMLPMPFQAPQAPYFASMFDGATGFGGAGSLFSLADHAAAQALAAEGGAPPRASSGAVGRRVWEMMSDAEKDAHVDDGFGVPRSASRREHAHYAQRSATRTLPQRPKLPRALAEERRPPPSPTKRRRRAATLVTMMRTLAGRKTRGWTVCTAGAAVAAAGPQRQPAGPQLPLRAAVCVRARAAAAVACVRSEAAAAAAVGLRLPLRAARAPPRAEAVAEPAEGAAGPQLPLRAAAGARAQAAAVVVGVRREAAAAVGVRPFLRAARAPP